MQGLETLALRMDAHVANAARVADHLRNHPLVSWVAYAGFDDSPSKALADRYLPKGPGAVMAFGVVGGRDGGREFIEALELCSHLANIGDTRTLVIHPASTTHQQLSDDAMKAAGVPPDLIRISVGIEDVDDILWDIDRALEHAAKQAE
jgi:O-acetylhomoserine (thiol)-lyase